MSDSLVFKRLMNNLVLYLILALLITLFLACASMAIGSLVKKSGLLEKVVYGKLGL